MTINGALLLDANGEQVDAAGNGTRGSSRTLNFHRFFGDVNGDRIVDGTDYLAFRTAYIGGNATTPAASIFDFDGDGQAEAVYRDECFLRVYNGRTGEVIYSAPASSGTGAEYPTVADVDGDFATEIVVPRTPYNACPKVDPIFPMSGDFMARTGFVIYRDPMDRWANSRPVWNQHPYYITHINNIV